MFAPAPFTGNPLAVVHDAEGLTDQQMQAITRWMNLSETAFLLPPTVEGADYRVRIFTLSRELPFAGHPTLGAAHAWLQAGGAPGEDGQVTQECGVGLVTVRRGEGGQLAFAGPPLQRYEPVSERDLDRLLDVLQVGRERVVDASWVDNGPGWAAVLLGSADEVLAVRPQPAWSDPTLHVGLVGPADDGADHAFEVRGLLTDERGGLLEDPVTGSLNASVARWLIDTGRATAPYVARQGTRLGRSGRVSVDQDERRRIWVGGAVTTIVAGHITA